MIRVHGRAEGAPETLPPGQSGILRGAGIDRSRMYGCRDYVRGALPILPPSDNLCHRTISATDVGDAKPMLVRPLEEKLVHANRY